MSERSDITNYVDKEAALLRLRGNIKLYRRMLDMLLNSEEFGKLESALARQDFAGAADAAHAIKGITGNLALPLLFDLSSRLMVDLRNGTINDRILEEYRAALTETFARVREVAGEINA